MFATTSHVAIAYFIYMNIYSGVAWFSSLKLNSIKVKEALAFG